MACGVKRFVRHLCRKAYRSYNMGCSPLLWDIGGRDLFNEMRANEAGFALSVQQSDEALLLKGLGEGTLDMALVCDLWCANRKLPCALMMRSWCFIRTEKTRLYDLIANMSMWIMAPNFAASMMRLL